MEPRLKKAYEEGRHLAEQEHNARLKKEIKKREDAVGWKEKLVAPPRLSPLPK